MSDRAYDPEVDGTTIGEIVERRIWRAAAARLRHLLAEASRLNEAGAADASLSWYEAVELAEREFEAASRGQKYEPPLPPPIRGEA